MKRETEVSVVRHETGEEASLKFQSSDSSLMLEAGYL